MNNEVLTDFNKYNLNPLLSEYKAMKEWKSNISGIYRLKDDSFEDSLMFVEPSTIFKIPTRLVKNPEQYVFKEDENKLKIEHVLSSLSFSLLEENIPLNEIENYLIKEEFSTNSHVYQKRLSLLGSLIRDNGGSIDAESYLELLGEGMHLKASDNYRTFTNISKSLDYSLVKKREIGQKEDNVSYLSMDKGIFNFLKKQKGNISLYFLGNSRINKNFPGLLNEDGIQSKLVEMDFPSASHLFKFIYQGDSLNWEMLFAARRLEI